MIEIIKAEENHVPDICQLWLEFMRFHGDIDPIFTPRDGALPVFEEKYLRKEMKSDNNLILVALDGKRVVGYSFSQIIDPSDLLARKNYGYIHDVAITADYRRNGIGEKMYDEILKWFHSRGIDCVEVEVTVKNRVAYSFWKKRGFTDYKHTLYRQI